MVEGFGIGTWTSFVDFGCLFWSLLHGFKRDHRLDGPVGYDATSYREYPFSHGAVWIGRKK